MHELVAIDLARAALDGPSHREHAVDSRRKTMKHYPHNMEHNTPAK